MAHPNRSLDLPTDAQAQRALFVRALEAIETALDTNQIVDAEQIVALTWKIVEQTSKPEHLARAHWCSGLAQLNWSHAAALEHYTAARSYFEQHGPAEDTARVLLGYGITAGYLGHLDDAEAALQQAAHHLDLQPDHPHWMRLSLNLSIVEGLRGRYRQMHDYARQAATAAERHQHRLIRASALVNQGMAAISLGHLDEAATLLQQGREWAGDTAEIRGKALVNQARLALYQGRLFAALHLLATARECFSRIEMDIDQATVAIEAASLYERLHMLREAQQQAVFAAETCAQARLPPESIEARLLAIRLALARGRTRDVPYHLAQAQRLAEHVAPTWRALLDGYTVHPALLRTREQRQAALARVDAATATLHQLGAMAEYLDVALLGAELAARLQLPEALTRYQHIATTAQKHELVAAEQRACIGQAALQRSKAACVPLRRAADLLSAQCQQMPVEELKASLLSGSHAVYVQLVEAQLKSHQPRAALDTLLEAKGGLWADLAAPTSPQAPDAAWLAARTDLATWQDERRFASDPAYVALCQQRIQEAEAALTETARHQARLRAPRPLVHSEHLLTRLAPEQTVIEYLVGTSHLHACVLRPEAPPQWVRLCKRSALHDLMGRMSLLVKSLQAGTTPEQRQSIAAGQRSVLDTMLAHLYNLLLEPLHAALPPAGELLIAPDALLYEVPWAALRLPDSYLAERYQVLLTPSAAVIGLSPMAPSSQPGGAPLALGYAGNPPLLHVAAELDTLRQALPNLDSRNPAHTSDLSGSHVPDLLHIAAHGHIRPHAPLLSHLALADGPFLLADALNLNLHGTRLVTLSACETGTIPERGGVLLALAGSFLVAGASTVLASLWPVEDAATHLLMGTFYRAIQRDIPFPQALQQAQQTVRAHGYDHPTYWAAFHLLTRQP